MTEAELHYFIHDVLGLGKSASQGTATMTPKIFYVWLGQQPGWPQLPLCFADEVQPTTTPRLPSVRRVWTGHPNDFLRLFGFVPEPDRCYRLTITAEELL